MKKLLSLVLICIAVMSLSCKRRSLTYIDSSTVRVQLNVDWSNLAQQPTGMSVYCYPEDGASPIVLQTNSTSSTTLDLPAGIYNIVLFNQTPTEFITSLAFSGMDKFETAEVSPASKENAWDTITDLKSDLATVPDTLAAATYIDLEITSDAIAEAVSSGTEDQVYKSIDLTPVIVVKKTRVTANIEGYYNLRDVRGVLHGMASGYNFATQKSLSTKISHQVVDWSGASYSTTTGKIVGYFDSFGLPETTTETRSVDNWDGHIFIDFLLVDNETITTREFDIADVTTLAEDLKSDLDDEADIYVDIEESIELEDVVPDGYVGSGFDASMEDWGDQENVTVPIV